jgi:hypothetical protein
VRLLFFTALWTAVWGAALPQLSRRVELIAGLIPFTAFGLRVFAACFLGVPEDDPVRRAVAPLVELAPGQWLLELFHGPTLAFKDVAMQLLARRIVLPGGIDVTAPVPGHMLPAIRTCGG